MMRFRGPRTVRWLCRAGITAAVLCLSTVELTAQAKAKAAPPATKRAAQAPAQGAQGAQAVKATKVTTVEGITEYSLPNGLRVLLVPDQSKPTVTVNITYLVGSRLEGYGETGMAHLLEHMAFKGTTNHKNIPQELADHGARFNATTSFDRTNYYEITPSTDANLEWALELEADRMVNSFIAKKDLESEFSVVRNEFEREENSPFQVTFKQMLSTAYKFHNYGKGAIGNKADIEGVPIERLQVFYKKYYQPDDAMLVVAGKFDPDKTLAIIENKFGRIPRPKRSQEAGNLMLATYTIEPVQDGDRFATVRRVGDTQILMMGYHIPAAAHPDYAALDILSDVLGASPSGRLYKTLVDTKKAASVGGYVLPNREPGLLFATTELRKDQSLDSARAAMAATLDTSRTFTTEEVERVKAQALKNTELLLNNSEQVGVALTEWAAAGDWRLLFLHRDRIRKVTPADVQRVASAYLKPSNRTVAAFIPTANPDRVEVPATPSIIGMVADYKGGAVVQAGEAFDASPRNIDARTKHSALPSGMQLTLLPKLTRGNRVVAQIVLRQGTEASLMGKGAIADLTAGMLERGTTALTRQQVKDSLDKLKAQVRIGSSANQVTVRIETLKDNLVPVLDLVAQELRSPRFDAAELDKLKQENLAQIEQLKTEPSVLASVTLTRILQPRPKGHVLYLGTPDESVAEINAVTLDQVKAFHQAFYGASDGDLAVVGDFDPAQVTAAASRLFGDWKSAQPFARIVRTFVPVDSSSQSIETPDKANAAFFAGQNLSLRDDDPDYAAMALGNFILGAGSLNSRLGTRLRQKEGISYDARTAVQPQSLDRTTTFVALAIYAPQNVDRVLAGVREELEKARTAGFTKEEVDAAKTGYLQLRSQQRANDPDLAAALVARRFAGRTMTSYDEQFENRVRALTAEQVNATVKKYLDPTKMVMVRAGDFAKHPPVKTTP
jgi:zinc protease